MASAQDMYRFDRTGMLKIGLIVQPGAGGRMSACWRGLLRRRTWKAGYPPGPARPPA